MRIEIDNLPDLDLPEIGVIELLSPDEDRHQEPAAAVIG
jgi:hypothetical protein